MVLLEYLKQKVYYENCPFADTNKHSQIQKGNNNGQGVHLSVCQSCSSLKVLIH